MRPFRLWRRRTHLGAVLSMAMAWIAPAAAEEVRIEHLGLALVGNLEGGSAGTSGTVVLIVHNALSLHSAAGPRALQAALAARGRTSLAITLSLGLEARRKPLDCGFDHDHRDADAVQEIVAWSQWLVERGATSLVLVGEGTGALQVAMEPETADPSAQAEKPAAAPPKPPLAGLVLVGPPPTGVGDRAADYKVRFGADLATVVAEARRVATEAGEDTSIEVPGFLGCTRARVTAGAFLDAYDPERAPDLVALLAKRRLPTLVFLAEDDPRRAPLGRSAEPHFNIETEILSTTPAAAEGLAEPKIGARIADFSGRFGR